MDIDIDKKSDQNTTPTVEEKEVLIEINENSNQIKKDNFDDKAANYNQVLFNYKNFNPLKDETSNLKRKSEILNDYGNNKILKKQDWISKETNNRGKNPLDKISGNKDTSSSENSCIIPIERRDTDSKNSLSIASDILSKNKLANNFGAVKDYNEYFKANKNDIEFSKSKQYEFDLQTIEEDNSFYDLKINKNRNSNPLIPNDYKKKASSPRKMINYRVKKEREKLQGYRCEICQNVKKIYL
jgi:hypothetical protein